MPILVATNLGPVTLRADADTLSGSLAFSGNTVEVAQWDILSEATPLLRATLNAISNIDQACRHQILSNFNDAEEDCGVRMLLDHHELPTDNIDERTILEHFRLALISIHPHDEDEPVILDYRLLKPETNYLVAVTLDTLHKVIGLSIES